MVNPDSSEECDNVDNDCNGLIDDGLPVFQFYYDGDGDLFGTIDSITQSCFFSTPTNFVTNHDDCDDTNPDINPNAIEILDSLDNNCNGIIDDVTGVDDLTNHFKVNISPNPVRSELLINYEYSGTLTFKIINLDGKF